MKCSSRILTGLAHANMATMLRGKVIREPAPAENGFIPHFKSWEKALTSKTRVIVLNYPSNPTGAYPTREYLQKLQDFAAEHNLWIVSDAVYEDLYYGGERPTSATVFEGRKKERTLLVNSLSKSYAMTGWRVGYLAAPQAVIDNTLKAGGKIANPPARHCIGFGKTIDQQRSFFRALECSALVGFSP